MKSPPETNVRPAVCTSVIALSVSKYQFVRSHMAEKFCSAQLNDVV